MEKDQELTVNKKNSDMHNRDSNIELFRIITMLMIIAHHYVVNSGLASNNGPIAAAPTSAGSIFLLLFGAWGKIGINCFVLITGYYMCKSQITAKKFAKLLCEIIFYNLIISILLSRKYDFSIMFFIKKIIPVTSIQHNFPSCFIVFYLFIPFLNILVLHMNERQHLRILLLLSFSYIMFGTIHAVLFNYVSWFIVLYFIASYIRLYPKKWFYSMKLCAILLVISLIISILSVICCAWIGKKVGMFFPFYFVTDSNTILAVLVGCFSFLFFKNIHLSYNKFINTIAASTFGVLLIHANSDTMRQWLWKDTLDNIGHFDDKFMPLYAVECVFGIFLVCSVIDIMRINLLEKPFFNWWDKHWNHFYVCFKRKEDNIFQKMNIE